MSVPTSQITLLLSGQSGGSLVGARVTMRLTDYDLASGGGGVIAPRLLEFQTDDNGQAIMNLWSNDRGTRNTQYELNVYHPITGRKVIDSQLLVVPDFDTTINGILTGRTNARPVAAFVLSPLTGKAPISILFDGSASSDLDGTINSYSWSVDGVVVGSGVTFNHTFSQGGTFSVSLSVTDNNGSTHSVSNNIVIDSVVGPNAGFTLNTPIEQGQTATATDTSTPGDNAIATVEYDWGIGAGFTANASLQFVTAGIYTVTQRVTDTAGYTDTAQVSLTVNASDEYVATQAVAGLSTAAPIASFTVSPQTGSGPLRVTIDPTASTITGWQQVWDQVAALQAGATKTSLQNQLTAMIDDLQFAFNYNQQV